MRVCTVSSRKIFRKRLGEKFWLTVFGEYGDVEGVTGGRDVKTSLVSSGVNDNSSINNNNNNSFQTTLFLTTTCALVRKNEGQRMEKKVAG